ncbi:hypothetical protein [Streptomyces sp. MST-110588]|uniref:hypothetical protein n=1 Tax=Streptomyces sp. MST-110588 TaxID=2833628 RepID=UPI001F5E2CB8|nr:hypothetical protein [Streptomyces sp. MST-110588]UNO38438.1 hypothetical protein KGS77_00695 [Streptomyces sp. MST-110588]
MTPSKGARSPSEEVRRRRRQGAAAGSAAAAAVLLASLAVQAGAKAAPPSTTADIMFFVGQCVMVWSLHIGHVVYIRRASVPGLAIWLRRFRSGYGNRIRFHRALGEACFGFARPVTIQDSSFSASLTSALPRLWFMVPLALAFWVTGTLAVALLLFIQGITSTAVFVVGLLAWTGVFSRALLALAHRRGVIERKWTDAQITRHLDRVRRGKRLVGRGVEVLKVARSDDRWREVVKQALSRADLAVIDISDLTPSIAWETGQAFDRLRAHRILLVAEEGSVRPKVLSGRLTAAGISAATVERALGSVVFYPADRRTTVMTRRLRYPELVKRLRQEITWRIDTPGGR